MQHKEKFITGMGHCVPGESMGHGSTAMGETRGADKTQSTKPPSKGENRQSQAKLLVKAEQ